MKIQVLLDMISFQLVNSHKHFGGVSCFYLQGLQSSKYVYKTVLTMFKSIQPVERRVTLQ